MTSIYIIDEHKIVMDSVALTLTKSNRYRVVGCSYDYKKSIFKILQIKPDIILIDHNQITYNGINCISEIKKKMSSVFIIIFTGIKDFGLLMEILLAGADGIISKCIGLDDMEKSLYRIESGEQFMGIGFKQFMMASRKGIRNTGITLTPREKMILYNLSAGKTRKNTAVYLNISEETVKYHCKNIFKKFNVHNLQSCINIARIKKLIV